MKNIFYIVCLVFFLFSCADEREISYLQDRNGVMYQPNQEKPFTGKFGTYYENGQKKWTKGRRVKLQEW
jgi:hypothetical protein